MLVGASMLLLAQPGNAGLMTAMSPANNAWLFVHRKNAWRAARESIEAHLVNRPRKRITGLRSSEGVGTSCVLLRKRSLSPHYCNVGLIEMERRTPRYCESQ